MGRYLIAYVMSISQYNLNLNDRYNWQLVTYLLYDDMSGHLSLHNYTGVMWVDSQNCDF